METLLILIFAIIAVFTTIGWLVQAIAADKLQKRFWALEEERDDIKKELTSAQNDIEGLNFELKKCKKATPITIKGAIVNTSIPEHKQVYDSRVVFDTIDPKWIENHADDILKMRGVELLQGLERDGYAETYTETDIDLQRTTYLTELHLWKEGEGNA